eukprot:CAMPEP_0114130378 /NCGR_PEP_ID=MMETSP0043_2-20121206/11985_1 /TAXON_ID=464988 /ORGANISM="Hemiselmis andersenii, Strain CCMP644" /LENGTH=406 /DNA_ID=CAMNT_0001223733 /DNA_START=1 /DNA_END=1222 /DNA_ORIENTATION=-
METAHRTMKVIALARDSPFDDKDLFELAHIQLSPCKDLLRASHFVFYLAVETIESGGGRSRRLWTRNLDGLGTKKDVMYGEGIAGWVAEQEESVLLDDPTSDPRFDRRVDTWISHDETPGSASKWDKYNVASRVDNLLAVPIKRTDGSMLGVCVVLNKKGGGFRSSDERLLRLVTSQMIVTLSSPSPPAHTPSPASNAPTTDVASTRHLYTIRPTAQVVSETVHEALDRCKRLAECEHALLFVRKGDDKLQLLAPRVVVPLSDSMIGYVARTGVTVSAHNVSLDPRYNKSLDDIMKFRTRNLLCVAVVSTSDSSQILGSLLVTNKTNGRAFSSQDGVLVSVLAKQLGATYQRHGAVGRSVPRLQTHLQATESDGSVTSPKGGESTASLRPKALPRALDPAALAKKT